MTLFINKRSYRVLTMVTIAITLTASSSIIVGLYLLAICFAALELLRQCSLSLFKASVVIGINACLLYVEVQHILRPGQFIVAAIGLTALAMAQWLNGEPTRDFNVRVIISTVAIGLLAQSAADAFSCLSVISVFLPLKECILLVAAQDFMASAAGKALPWGRLAPKISPNKTISGAFAGLLAGIAVWLLLQFGQVSNFSFPEVLLILLAGLFGDLIFSSVKRALDIKDFSHALGFKGGILDRVDSTIAALLVATRFIL